MACMSRHTAAPHDADAGPATTGPAEPTPTQRRGMRYAISTQCFAAIGVQAFQNGILLLYFKAMDVSDALNVLLLAMMPVANAVLLLPSAYVADRVGKKRIGLLGTIAWAAGYAMLALAGWMNEELRFLALLMGVLVFGLGFTMFMAGWFALLSSVVPQHMRGKFFGRLRTTFQIVVIAFTAACTFWLTEDSPIWKFQVVVGVIALGAVVRIPLYWRIPELEPSQRSGARFWPAIGRLLQAPRFMPFTAYVFLLQLFTFTAPSLFGLLEKDTLGFSERAVVWMGNLLMVGALLGFVIGGRIVDRWGTRPVFLICHLGMAAVLALIVGRGLWPAPTLWLCVGANLGFGLFYAASSIAISTELLGLIPQEDKSMSTSLANTMMGAGRGLSGALASGGLGLGMLAERWSLFGATLGAFDALLLLLAVLILVSVVTLGLVPSVVGKPGWVPQ